MKAVFSFVFFLISLMAFTEDLKVYDVPFMQSMGKHAHPRRMKGFFLRLQECYEKNHFLRVLETKPPNYQGIPKIIHQIWIGSNKLPEKCKPLMQSWLDKHPGWQYKLWTNEDLESFQPVSGTAIANSTQIGCKVDILKYEILFRHGGVYVDVDFECLKPLDIVVENSQFFAALYERSVIGQGIIGSVKEHPLLYNLVTHFKNCQNKILTKPIKETGPRFFSTEIQEYMCRPNSLPLLIFPLSFFHSFPRSKRKELWELHKTTEELVKKYTFPETFAIHYWGHTWAD